VRREREVSVEEAGRWASREGIGFLEASALDGRNVEEAFFRCARQILTKVELGTKTPSPPNPPPSGGSIGGLHRGGLRWCG
jgi:Ras family